jgi:DNA/RNA endonuclease YhcR with UshA esterase domain
MKYLFILLVGLITTTAFAQTEIKVDEAKTHVGETVKICTKIFGGKYLENSKGTPTFLNAGGSYPNAPLTLVIWADARKEFKNKPEEYYAGKSVCVTGKIELFKDKPQIVINKEEQIRETINDKLIINEPR